MNGSPEVGRFSGQSVTNMKENEQGSSLHMNHNKEELENW